SVSPVAMRRLMREISELKKSPPEGIRIQTDDNNMLDVIGIIEGPEGTPYSGGYFRVKFRFTEEFPAAPPKCAMMTKIFHPNVSSAGEICVNTLKKDWKSTYGISHILVTVKCLLIYPNPESALDEDAGKLLLENYASYCSRAKLITSVHATPKTRPEEFDVPSVVKDDTPTTTNAASSSASSSGSSTPAVSTAATTPSSSLASPVTSTAALPTVRKTSSSLAKTSATTSAPQQRSPKPLSTADANVDTIGGKSTADVGVGVGKAVKRAAVGTGTTGVEKRKKALKRL
ncbi:ubiquitin-conjugating enzyme/RWD-like protein, partial [Pterulicium gracile]